MLNHAYTTDDGVILRPQLLAAVDVEASTDSPNVAMNLANSANTDFIAPSPAPGKTAALIRLGLEAQFSQKWSGDAGIAGRFSSNQQQALFHLDATYHF